MSFESTGETPMAERRPPLRALIATPVVLACLVAFTALSVIAGSLQTYVGLFFLIYWAGERQGRLAALPVAVAGALFGLALAYALYWLVGRFGPMPGGLAFLALVAPVLFCQLAGFLPLVVNNAAMLVLTAATIPQVQAQPDFRGMVVSLAIAVGLFAPLVWLAERARARLNVQLS